ncbi:MAG: fibronectin type III domain-containing protein, partial [Fibrobacteres bacterium]|nr:fibronectin type III domain-containing protein [Fibrobacterota bacterium]
MKFLIITLLVSFSFSATRIDVVPINWAGIKSTPPSDSLSLTTKKLMNNSIKYFISHYLETLPDSAGLFRLSAYTDSNHSKIREPATGSELIGTALATGSYDSLIVGKGLNEIVSTEVKLIKSLTTVYWGNGGTFLGGWNCWQCALWAAQCGLGAWLVWDKLDTLTQTQIARMLEKEANKLYYDPPYCNDCTDDTKAEENAWMAMAMTLSIAMMPNHPNASTWKTRASQWMLSAFARESDLRRNVLVDGKLPRDWIRGWNMNENGYVYNHGLTHPDYMCTIMLNVYSSMYQSLAGQTISQAAIYNFDEVYNCFANYKFPVPPFRAPGGTIYQEGKANVYYPSGTDWSNARIDLHLQVSAFASLFPDVAKRSAIHPDVWAKIRADTIEWRMKRFTTGQQYAPGEWDYAGQSPWILAEVMGGSMFSSTYLARWIKSSGAFSKVGNWHLTTPDTVPPNTPANISATAADMSTIALRWNRVTDVGSGTAYYLLLRDNKEIAITKDTAYTDNNLLSGTTFSYKVFPIDFNNNKSLSPAAASATTLSDASALLPVKAAVIDSATLNIAFSNNVDSSTASLLSNYTGEGFTISGVTVCKSGNEVLLKISPL